MHERHYLLIQRLFVILLWQSIIGQSACFAEDELRTTFSGFGTLGGLHNSSNTVGFVRDTGQRGDHNQRYSVDTDTRLGFQLNQRLDKEIEFVGQVVAKKQEVQNFNTTISRAFVRIQPVSGLQIRIGRIGDSSFVMSDYRDIGYAYPWVRPPETTYSVVSLQDYDGADIAYTLNAEDVTWRIKALAGKVKMSFPVSGGGNYVLDSRDGWGGLIVREQGLLKIWGGYSTFISTNNYSRTDQLLSYLANLPSGMSTPYTTTAEGQDILRSVGKDRRISYASFSFSYDDNTWMGQGELGKLSSQTLAFTQGTQAYLSVGRHFGDLMPYALWGTFRAPKAMLVSGDWGVYQTSHIANVAQINAIRVDQDTLAFGARWDIHNNTALKIQWSRMHVRNNGWGLWAADPLTKAKIGDANVNIVSATLDFVF